MNVITSEQRTRARNFETVVEEARAAIHDPRVIAELGARGCQLTGKVEGLFLPNVHQGRISLPRSQRDTDNFALLPLLENERNGELLLHTSMHEPTLQRREAYARAGGGTKALKKAVCERTMTIPKSVPLSPGAHAKTYASALPSQVTGIPFFTTRPIIFFGDMRPDRGEVGAVADHEVVHGLQDEELTDLQAIHAALDTNYAFYETVTRELEGHHVGAVLLRASGLNDLNHSTYGLTLRVEDIRQAYASPEMPYRPTEEMAIALEQLGILDVWA